MKVVVAERDCEKRGIECENRGIESEKRGIEVSDFAAFQCTDVTEKCSGPAGFPPEFFYSRPLRSSR
eukprot:85566-Rhodomonas_salina.1